MGKKYIVNLNDETQIIVEVGANSTGAALISSNPISALTPYTEPDTEKIRKEAFDDGYQQGMQLSIDDAKLKEEYRRGLNDAWECVDRIFDMPCLLREQIFSKCNTVGVWDIIRCYFASEAIEKIRQYEQEQEIKVGDEVIGIYNSGEQTEPFVIISGNRDYYYGIYSKRREFCQGGLKLQKTGRRFPEIAEVLQKMKEEKPVYGLDGTKYMQDEDKQGWTAE